MEKIGVRSFFVFSILSLLLIFLDLRGTLVPIRYASSYLTSPIMFVSSQIETGFYDSFSFLSFWKSGEQRIKNLEQQNLELSVFASRAVALEKENKILRMQLNVPALTERKMVPAKVLGKDRFLIIGAGDPEGIKVGDVVVYKDSLVGKIRLVAGKISFVELPTDTKSRIPAYVLASESVRGLIIGQFNSSLVLDQVVQTEQIAVGQSVLTSGEDGQIPEGLLMGKVGKTLSKETDLFKRVEIRPAIRYEKLEMVFVLP